jgi:ATP-dependent RNA helicase RhlE
LNISIFSELPLDAAILRGVEDFHYKETTPIQRMAIPVALAGHDVFASAPTGSGKSAAFGIPVLQKLLEREDRSAALILTPTRELAQQIAQHLGHLAKHTDLRIVPVYGGVAMQPQIKALRRGASVIVATPGRLIDLMQQNEVRLDSVATFVLDEADRMLDMGFLPAVKRIIAKLPARRQTLCFSATLGGDVAQLARDFMNEPVRISLAAHTVPVQSVTQWVYDVEPHKKTDLLVDLLKDGVIFNAIVFTRTKSRAERVASALMRHRVDVERIHGDRSQAQRTRALEAFKKGRHRVLVATDVAARGIDINDLGHVINYDVPADPIDYVHRIGRTGRAQKRGDAITFVSRDEAGLFARIEGAIGAPLQRTEHQFMDPVSAQAFAVAPQVHRRTFQRRRRR